MKIVFAKIYNKNNFEGDVAIKKIDAIISNNLRGKFKKLLNFT